MCHKWIQWCKDSNTKWKVSAYSSIHINRLIFLIVIKGQQVLQRPCASYLQKNISVFCSLSLWSGSFFLFDHLFSSFFPFSPPLHSLSPRGLWSQTRWQDPNLENEMKCSSLFPLVTVFFILKFEGIGIGSVLEKSTILFTPFFQTGLLVQINQSTAFLSLDSC